MHFRLALFAAAALLSGCVRITPVKVKPIAPNYGEQQNLVKYEEPKQELLTIGQVVDARPEEERTERTPRTWFLLLAYSRKGDYYPGDKAWVPEADSDDPPPPGAVAEDVTTSLADCFRKTNHFEKVEVDPKPEPAPGKGLILKVELERLDVVQKVEKRGYLIIITWGAIEELGTPLAQCRLKYTLIDGETNQVLKSRAIEAKSTDNKIDLVQNGIRALQMAETLVANEVTKLLAEL